jgi:hypothetical protein
MQMWVTDDKAVLTVGRLSPTVLLLKKMSPVVPVQPTSTWRISPSGLDSLQRPHISISKQGVNGTITVHAQVCPSAAVITALHSVQVCGVKHVAAAPGVWVQAFIVRLQVAVTAVDPSALAVTLKE